MPCLALPTPPLPDLPSPFSVTPPVVDFPRVPNACCKLPPIPPPKIPIRIPPLVLAASIAPLQQGVKAILAYLDRIPLKCPRE